MILNRHKVIYMLLGGQIFGDLVNKGIETFLDGVIIVFKHRKMGLRKFMGSQMTSQKYYSWISE